MTAQNVPFDATTLAPRVPPHDQAAELALIGSVLLDGGISALVEPVSVTTKDFYLQRHQHIWDALLRLDTAGTPADLVTLAEELTRANRLDDAGGAVYLTGLQDGASTSAYAGHYARIVAEKSLLRQFISASARLASNCYDPQVPLEDILAQASKLSLVGGELPGTRMRDIGAAADEVVDWILNGRDRKSIGTGLKDVDRKIDGLEPGRLYILAARPGMGKSLLAMQMGVSVAKQGGRVLGISLEMSDTEITERLLAQEARVGLTDLKAAQSREKPLDDRAAGRLLAAHETLRALPFTFDDRSSLNLDEFMREARREHARAPLSLIIIDYLQLFSVPELENNETAKIGRISQSLKRLARELNVPVLCLSQLSREVEKRPNHRPVLSDLRQSGSIEQDADVVIFIYRDEKYDENTVQRGVAELIIPKNRSGETGMVKVAFNDRFLRFSDLAYGQ